MALNYKIFRSLIKNFEYFENKPHIAVGVSGGPDTPAPFHAITTVLYKDQDALEASMALAGPAFEDVPNYFDAQPIVQISEVLD